MSIAFLPWVTVDCLKNAGMPGIPGAYPILFNPPMPALKGGTDFRPTGSKGLRGERPPGVWSDFS